MKKGILLIVCIVFGVYLYGQGSDSIPQQGFAFPFGSKVTIQLVPLDSVNYNYRVLKFEAFHETIDLDSMKKILPDSVAGNIIEFVFTYGMYGSDKNDKDNKLKIVLELRSGLRDGIEYKADIQVPNKDFETTSVVPLLHQTLNREFWPYQIDTIALHSFHKYQLVATIKNKKSKRK